MQRDRKLTASIGRVMANTRADDRPAIIQVHDLHMKILQQVAGGLGAPLRREQYTPAWVNRAQHLHGRKPGGGWPGFLGARSPAETELGRTPPNVPRLFRTTSC